MILRPAVQKRYLELTEPSLSDQRSDIERVLDGLDDLELRVDLSVLRSLGRVLRGADYKVTAVVVDEALIDVQPGDTTGSRYGIAFDLGTTTVVATLLDLSTGTPMAVSSMLSKQQPFGADVISRISAVMLEPQNLDRLTELAHSSLGDLVTEVCDEAGVDPYDVYEVALAGNATMTHLALGIDPEPLGVAPFILAARLLPEILAADVGAAGAPEGAGRGVPGVRRLRRRGHHRRAARFRHEPGRQDPAVHRHRHELRDRAGQPRVAARHRGAGRAWPSRVRRSGAVCGRPTARSKESCWTPGRRRGGTAGHRRHGSQRGCAALGLSMPWRA